jgi:hypothetical protein
VTEAAGYWWSAASPENRVPGVVRLAAGKHYELTTIGSLGESFNDPGTWPMSQSSESVEEPSTRFCVQS